MRTLLVILVILFLGFVVVLPRYLAPNDLSGCESVETAGTCRAADAIVAVSGGDTTARALEAVNLYKAGWAKQIIFSGAAEDPESPSNALAMKRFAIAQEVPASRITIEEFSRNTEENARNTSRFIQQQGLKRIILVTSAYHQRRATLEFGAKLGNEVQIVSHPVAQDDHWGPFWWLSFNGWRLAVGELAKIIYFYTHPQDIFKL